MYGPVCCVLVHFTKIVFFKSTDISVSHIHMFLCNHVQSNIVFASLLWISGLIF